MSVPIQNVLALAGHIHVRSGHLQMLDLLTGLASRGCGVSLLCASLPPEIAPRETPFPVTTWGALGGRWSGRVSCARLRDFCDREKMQVVHVHGAGLRPSGRRFLRIARTPVVYTPYSPDDHLREVQRVWRRAARVIALSESMREGLVNRARISREKLRVVPPGINLGLYASSPPRIGERLPVVGTVAPLDAERGQSVFLRAAGLLAGSGRDAEFVVAGDGRAERALRREAADLGIEKRVTFVTRLSNYRDVIAALDVFVRPALTGGIGYTVLEAMAMAKAVVATSAGSIPEMAAQGRTALIVAKDDAATLADAVGQLLANPRAARELGACARRSVAERFSMDRLVENTLRVYGEAVEEASE